MTLERIAIVLVETTHPGNIGATARVMGNMGLTDLRLVTPRRFPDPDADARASGADAILSSARVFDHLADALADCHYVVGTTARRREASWTVHAPVAAATELLRRANEGLGVALVFGRESSGLSNAETDLCDALVTVPVNPDFPSLNLAAAVTILSYELRRLHLEGASVATEVAAERAPPATVEEREMLFRHLEQTMRDLAFLKVEKPDKLMRKIRHLYLKAQPVSEEVAILRGILSSIQEQIDK